MLEQAARLTLAIGLMGVALRLPPAYPLQHWRSLSVLLGLVMPLMCLSTVLLAHWLLGLALLVGAVVAPTDPIVATAVVTSGVVEENLPDRVRHTISAESEEEQVQEAVNHFFTLPIFVLLGLMLPWQQWRELGWRAPALAVLVLLLRRLPAVLILKAFVPQLKERKDALFAGWFGPIGVAALFYATLAVRRTEHEIVWSVGSLLVCASLIAHGMTATPLTKFYDRYSRSKP